MMLKNEKIWLILSFISPIAWVAAVIILANSFWSYLIALGLLVVGLVSIVSFFRRKNPHKLLVIWTGIFASFCLLQTWAAFLGTRYFAKKLLAGESLIQSPAPVNSEPSVYSPKQEPPKMHSNYDCAKLKSISKLNKWCYIVAGDPVARDTLKLDDLRFSLPNDWKMVSGKKESSSNVYYQIWYPPGGTVVDADSGPIYIKKGDEVMLTIEYINAKSDFKGKSLEEMAEGKVSEYAVLLESNQKFEFSDIKPGWRNFRNGKNYLMLSYPYYWRNVPDRDTPVYSLDFKDPRSPYTPDFSAHNQYDYYLGDTGTNAIAVIYDWKKLPEAELNSILQNLSVWIK